MTSPLDVDALRDAEGHLCACDVCIRFRARADHRYRDARRKREYRPCEVRRIALAGWQARLTYGQIASAAGVTRHGVRYALSVLRRDGLLIDDADATNAHTKPMARRRRQRKTRVVDLAPEIARSLAAGEMQVDISARLGVNVQHLLWRIRSGRSRRPVDLALLEVAGPALSRSAATRASRAKRRIAAARGSVSC